MDKFHQYLFGKKFIYRTEFVKSRQGRTGNVSWETIRQFKSGDKVWFRDYRGPDKW